MTLGSDSSDLPIQIEPEPRWMMSAYGEMDETVAALYLTYRMRNRVKPRTLRYWRVEGQGPTYHKGHEHDRRIWYRKEEIDAWLEDTAIDPLAA